MKVGRVRNPTHLCCRECVLEDDHLDLGAGDTQPGLKAKNIGTKTKTKTKKNAHRLDNTTVLGNRECTFFSVRKL